MYKRQVYNPTAWWITLQPAGGTLTHRLEGHLEGDDARDGDQTVWTFYQETNFDPAEYPDGVEVTLIGYPASTGTTEAAINARTYNPANSVWDLIATSRRSRFVDDLDWGTIDSLPVLGFGTCLLYTSPSPRD